MLALALVFVYISIVFVYFFIFVFCLSQHNFPLFRRETIFPLPLRTNLSFSPLSQICSSRSFIFLPKYSHTFRFFAGFFRYYLLVFRGFFVCCLPFRWFREFCMLYLAFWYLFALVDDLFMFFCLILWRHFFFYNMWTSVDIFVRACFAVSFCLPTSFLVFVLLEYIQYTDHLPYFPLYFSPWSSLHTTTIFANMIYFFTFFIHPKTWPARSFYLFFCFVFVPTCEHTPIAPICIHDHASAPMFYHFWQNPQNIMVVEIFPDHRAQILTSYALNLPFLPFFVPPPCPLHPNAFIITHLHPFAPICICLYSNFTCTYHMFNLIKK